MSRVLTGTIVSIKMNKTMVVEVESRKPHPLYKKMIKRTKRYKAHSEKDVVVGDKVKIIETRPISRQKHFKVVEKL